MSLNPSVFATKRRKAIYGIVAFCLLALLCVGVIAYNAPSVANAKASAMTGETLPTPVPVTSPTAVPVTSPSPNPTLSTSPSPVPSVSPSATPRNPALYENGGTITLGTNNAANAAVLSQLRTFILRKWNARQLGRLALVSQSPANQPFTRNFYIEQNAEGNWLVTLESQNSVDEFFFVEEIGVSSDGRPILEPRPGGPQAVSRALHLKSTAQSRSGNIF